MTLVRLEAKSVSRSSHAIPSCTLSRRSGGSRRTFFGVFFRAANCSAEPRLNAPALFVLALAAFSRWRAFLLQAGCSVNAASAFVAVPKAAAATAARRRRSRNCSFSGLYVLLLACVHSAIGPIEHGALLHYPWLSD